MFGTAWWFIYAGMVLPYPFRWSLQCGFGWVEVSMMKKKLGLVGLGGLRFNDEEAQTSQCGTVLVRNYIELVKLDFTLRNLGSISSSSMLRRTHKTSLLDSSCYSALESNTLELLVS